MKLLSVIGFSLVSAIVCFAQQSGQVFGIGHWVTTSDTYGRNALCARSDSVNFIEISLFRRYHPGVRPLDTHRFYIDVILNGEILYSEEWISTSPNLTNQDYYHKNTITLNPNWLNVLGSVEIRIRESGHRRGYIEYIRDQIYSYKPFARQIELTDDYYLIAP